MARSFNVLYKFIAKDKFSATSKKIASGNKKLGTSFTQLDDKVKKSGKRFQGTSRAFISGFKGMAVAAVAAFGVKEFVQTGAQFQDALADLSAITGATGKDLDKLKNKTLSMAKASVTSQADVAEAIKLVASAKPELLDNIDALTATTDAVLLLKNAAGIELSSAANITAQGLNIFGAEASRAGEFVNVLAAGAKLGSSEIADTGAAMLIAGPGAKAAGLSFVQLNAAIQTVAKSGIKGSQAGTALNAIFGRLRRSGKDFKELGLQGAFEAVRKELDATTNSTMRAQLEAKIFGEEHAKVGLAVLDNANLLTQYESSLLGTNVASEQAAVRMSTFSKKLAKLGIIIKGIVIKAFLLMEPILSSAIDSVTRFIEGIDPVAVGAFGAAISAVAKEIFVPFELLFNILQGIGSLIGQIVASVATLDFSQFDLGSAFSDAISIFTGDDSAPTTGKPIGTDNKSTTDINMNINDPGGVVQSVQSSTQGRGANVGLNVAGG